MWNGRDIGRMGGVWSTFVKNVSSIGERWWKGTVWMCIWWWRGGNKASEWGERIREGEERIQNDYEKRDIYVIIIE